MNKMRLDLWRHARRNTRIPAVFALLGCAAFSALAQGTTPAAPPQTSTSPAKPTAAPKAPRQVIELPKAERQALEAEGAPRQTTGPTQADLVPTEADARAPLQSKEKETHIEQVRTSNRISEIRVTPALTGRMYTITNREGRQPTSATDTSSNLSVPKFFTFEWGGKEERPSPALPPPPSSSTPR